jgi:cardiolipin synthase
MSSSPLEKSAVEPMTITPPVREPGHVDVQYRWHGGNRIELLENGEEYFPRVFAALRAAKSEILLETFIVFEDTVGAKKFSSTPPGVACAPRSALTVLAVAS